MSTETILTKIVENVPTACWLAVASWLGYELRQWRIWLQNRHGRAPDVGGTASDAGRWPPRHDEGKS